MYEGKHLPLVSRPRFQRRLLLHLLAALALCAGSLLAGPLDFVHVEGDHWHDALLNLAAALPEQARSVCERRR